MPSSNKTSHLQLNQWIGSDKPRKDDFNADNFALDTAVGGLHERIVQLEESGGDQPSEEVLALFGSHTQDADRHTTAAQKGKWDTHAANAEIHVTAQEKNAWNNAGGGGQQMVIGTFVGDGTSTRVINMGFRPCAGFFFAVSRSPVEPDFRSESTDAHIAFFSQSGCSYYVTLMENGIRIQHTVTNIAGACKHLYNASGVTYVYVAWHE